MSEITLSDYEIAEGILLADKPVGMSSFDVIRYLKRVTDEKKFGHAGTLDPLASGLMIIGYGSGTKKMSEYVGMDKTYVAGVRLGEKRSTGDMEGEVIETKTVAHLDCEQIAKVVNGFSGIHRLPVPRYSAVKVDGVPLYKRARAGEVFEPPVREMKVLSMSLAACERVGDFFELTVEMNVASGVYVRSVVEVLGEVLGTVATTTSLRRTSIGEHNVASLNVFTI